MVTYVAPSGARVFSTGTMQWSWGLDNFGSPQVRSSRLNPKAQQITRNVLETFGALPVDRPIAYDHHYSVKVDNPLHVNSPGLLAERFSQTESSRLFVGPNNGNLSLSNNGSFTYSPNQAFQGYDQFTYITERNGKKSDPAQVILYVNPMQVTHHWSIDENNTAVLIDKVNPTANGQIHGASQIEGILGKALHFDGRDDHINLNQGSLQAPWTASLWIKPKSIKTDAVILDSPEASIKLQQWPDTGSVGFTRYGVEDYVFDFQAPIDTWSHLTFLNDGNSTALYANCSYLNNHPNTIDLPMNLIGNKIDGNSNLHADLDELKVFDRTLKDIEIESLCDK